MSAFHRCKGFSEDVAHACACSCRANGKAFLRGMRQAAFLKAVGKFLPMWESPTLSQANENPEVGISCESQASGDWVSLRREQEGLEGRGSAVAPSWQAGLGWRSARPSVAIVSPLQGAVSSLPPSRRAPRSQSAACSPRSLLGFLWGFRSGGLL